MSRTDQEIVDQTNKLALFYLQNGVGTGYVPSDDYQKLYEHLEIPRFNAAWQLAREAQLQLTSTDPDDALSALPEEPNVYRIDLKIAATCYVRAASEDEAKRFIEEQMEAHIELNEDEAGAWPITGREFGHPDLPTVSLSPAMTVAGPYVDGDWNFEMVSPDLDQIADDKHAAQMADLDDGHDYPPEDPNTNAIKGFQRY